MSNTVFQDIHLNNSPAEIVRRGNEFTFVSALEPAAKRHFVGFPNVGSHLVPSPTVEKYLEERSAASVGRLIAEATRLASSLGMESYRIVINTGEDAGATVPHFHVHLIGGEELAPLNSKTKLTPQAKPKVDAGRPELELAKPKTRAKKASAKKPPAQAAPSEG